MYTLLGYLLNYLFTTCFGANLRNSKTATHGSGTRGLEFKAVAEELEQPLELFSKIRIRPSKVWNFATKNQSSER